MEYWSRSSIWTKYYNKLWSERKLDKIEMIHVGSDYPGGYKVEISSDGINYTQVTLNNVDIGFGAKMVLIPSTPQTAQYVRISITDSSRSSYWWSITELNILWKNVNG